MSENNKQLIPTEQIMNKIFLIRDEKVMLDVHLSEIYDVETRALKQAVRRNMDLFPDDFMFILTDAEVDIMVSQNVIPSKQHLGGSKPFVFTETGVAMLSSVLKSKITRNQESKSGIKEQKSNSPLPHHLIAKYTGCYTPTPK